MIRFIAAIDRKLGIADEHGIPWQGRLPSDVKYYRKKIRSGKVLIGYGLYKELTRPYDGGVNYVATQSDEQLEEGFEPVKNARLFLEEHSNEEIWNLGGALLFSSTIDLAQELYLTRIDEDFHCTKFFPKFDKDFELVSQTSPQLENGINFHFEVWRRQSHSLQKTGTSKNPSP